MDAEHSRLRRRYERERKARQEAEAIAERATRDLYGVIAQLERFKAILQFTPDFVAITDGDGAPLYVNNAARGVLAWHEQSTAVLGDHYSPSAQERLWAEALPAAQRDGVWTGELELRGAAGMPIPVSQVLLAKHDAEGQVEYFAGIARDMTAQKALEARLAHQALHDPLTDLPNRLLFADRVERVFARRDDGHELVTVLFIDVDDFKTVNDSLGHGIGDRLLVAVAERLLDSLRIGDTAARLGGDEFAVLLAGIATSAEATAVAERILAALRQPFDLDGREIRVSGSIGIALQRPGTEDTDVLLRSADVAMYLAKSNGKDRYEVFEASMHDRVVERLELKADLQRAVDRDEFVLHYQPIVELTDGHVTGFEALLRWQHPTRGVMPPDAFLPLLEETGLIVPVGRWVLAEACRQVHCWQAEHPGTVPLTISVNLSARQLQPGRLADDVKACLRAADIHPTQLTLEITESTLMRDADGAAETLAELKALGVRLAIDDFGTGYSSLSYLRRFPIDVVKIDRSFVAPIASDPSGLALVRSIHDLAQALHVDTVAEGIEQLDQATALQDLGCLLGQGYLYARPLTPTDVTALLETGRPTTTDQASAA